MLILSTTMDKKSNTKVFTLVTILDGNLIHGQVTLSPAPEPGIMTEIAKLDAQRMVAEMVFEDLHTRPPFKSFWCW